MFEYNPFVDLASTIPLPVIQAFVALMFVLVIGGTLYDVWHKGSAQYFFNNMKKAEGSRTRRLSGGDKASLAAQTVMSEVLTSSEFCNPRRRLSHLLTMYGFIFYVASTAALVFWYSTKGSAAPSLLTTLWHLGALMVCIGGYWFWFFIRVDVAAEGNSPFRVVRADLFILSLLASATMALIWSYLQWTGSPWTNVRLRCACSPRSCCLALFRGPSSRICSSSRPPPTRSGSPRRMVQERTCPGLRSDGPAVHIVPGYPGIYGQEPARHGAWHQA